MQSEENPDLKNKRRLISAGAGVGALVLLAIYIYAFAGGTSRDDLETAEQFAKEHEAGRQAEPVPPLPPGEPKATFGKRPHSPS